MSINYDPVVDALYIKWEEQPIADSDEVMPGVVLDYDKDSKVVGVEVLGLMKRLRE